MAIPPNIVLADNAIKISIGETQIVVMDRKITVKTKGPPRLKRKPSVAVFASG